MNEPELKKVSAYSGIHWITESFGIFSKGASIWIVMLILFFIINLLLTSLPYLELLPTFFAPIFSAGFMHGARALKSGAMLEIDHLFAGFKQQFRLLFRLGAIYFLINVVIYSLSTLYLNFKASPEQLEVLLTAESQQQLQEALMANPELLAAVLSALLLALILTIPLLMAAWFSPALVYFDGLGPIRAMALSIQACQKNFLAFLAYAGLLIPLMVMAIIPFGLGLIVILPVTLISQYVSYLAIFPRKGDGEEKSDDDEEGVLIL